MVTSRLHHTDKIQTVPTHHRTILTLAKKPRGVPIRQEVKKCAVHLSLMFLHTTGHSQERLNAAGLSAAIAVEVTRLFGLFLASWTYI